METSQETYSYSGEFQVWIQDIDPESLPEIIKKEKSLCLKLDI